MFISLYNASKESSKILSRFPQHFEEIEKSSWIRQKSESQNRRYEEISTPNFLENEHFLPPDTHTYVTPVVRFVLLLYYRQSSVISYFHYLKSVWIWSFFWFAFSRIRTRKQSEFGHFSRSVFIYAETDSEEIKQSVNKIWP